MVFHWLKLSICHQKLVIGEYSHVKYAFDELLFFHRTALLAIPYTFAEV